MSTKRLWMLSLMLLCVTIAMGQSTRGYIISVEGNAVYVDLTSRQVQPGDKLLVYGSGGYMTHPVTKKKIKKNDVFVTTLEVGQTFDEYSIALPYNIAELPKVEVGMRVQTSTAAKSTETKTVNDAMTSTFVNSENGTVTGSTKIPVVVAPAQVNDVVNNGHFGGYVADILMEQLLQCERVRLLDRSVLNAQISEIDLAGDILDKETTIRRGKVIGARYILQTTMQKPDVANIRTGVPLASVMGAIQGATGTNIGAAYASNMQVATLKASVSISVRVVDLQTGEVVFMTSGEGNAKGKSQLRMEYGALGGGELNGGAEDFKQTITGKAITQAFRRIGRNLNAFFNGETDKKVMGTIGGGPLMDERMYAKGYSLYLGTEKLDKEGAKMAFAEKPNLYFNYKKAKRYKRLAWALPITGAAVGIAIGGALADSSIGVSIAVPCAIGLPAIGGGIYFGIAGKKKIRNVVSSYNAEIGATSYYQPRKKPQATLAFTGNGLRLSF